MREGEGKWRKGDKEAQFISGPKSKLTGQMFRKTQREDLPIEAAETRTSQSEAWLKHPVAK